MSHYIISHCIILCYITLYYEKTSNNWWMFSVLLVFEDSATRGMVVVLIFFGGGAFYWSWSRCVSAKQENAEQSGRQWPLGRIRPISGLTQNLTPADPPETPERRPQTLQPPAIAT